jgi:hypothetical protein
MPDVVDRLLLMTPKQLKRHRTKKGKVRGPYKRIPRPKRSRKELIDYMRENDFRTRDQLLRGRGDKDPAPYDFVKEFGSWTCAMDFIWQREIPAIQDRKYVVKSIVEFNLWTRSAYRNKRQQRPDILPSVGFIYKEFGSWGTLKELARAFSLKATLEAYVSLRDSLGRMPTMEDCRRSNINMDRALKVLGGKRELNQLIRSMEEMV